MKATNKPKINYSDTKKTYENGKSQLARLHVALIANQYIRKSMNRILQN
jgi:hypothetical protein